MECSNEESFYECYATKLLNANFEDEFCPRKCLPISIPPIKPYEDWPTCDYLSFDNEFDCAFEIAKTQFRNASYMEKCLQLCSTLQYIGKRTDINSLRHEISRNFLVLSCTGCVTETVTPFTS